MSGPSRGGGVPGVGAVYASGGGSGGEGLSSSSARNNPSNGFLGYSKVTSWECDVRLAERKLLQ